MEPHLFSVKIGMKKIALYDHLEINRDAKNCMLDGKKYKTLNGAWTFYVPKIQTKWFYSRDQKIICLHRTAPKDVSEINSSTDYGTYSAKEWKDALSECIFTKAATNYVIIDTLHKHGLGPKPLGFSVVKSAISEDGRVAGCAVGVEVENILKLKRKSKATELDFKNAGIITDKINSSLRQQIRGYVSDLNSVVSVRLDCADSRIEDLASMLKLSKSM